LVCWLGHSSLRMGGPHRLGRGPPGGDLLCSAGGLLSYYLKGGSNVLALIVLQSAALMGILFSVGPRTGFLDFLDAGHFPSLVAKLEFLALGAVLPNIVVIGRLRPFTPWIAGLASIVLFVQWMKVRRLELKRP
jgi:hypothetical protein